MTNESLTSAIAAERRRDMIAAAQHARLVREATTPPVAPTPSDRPRGLFGRRVATA
jgi:hypothetical protein